MYTVTIQDSRLNPTANDTVETFKTESSAKLFAEACLWKAHKTKGKFRIKVWIDDLEYCLLGDRFTIVL